MTNIRPNANNDNATTDSRQEIEINVLSNDSDPNGDNIFVQALEGEDLGSNGIDRFFPRNGGEFFIEDNGRLRFDPRNDFDDLRAGESRTTSARYTISDGRGGTDTATISVQVTNQTNTNTGGALDARNDSATTQAGEKIQLNVLDNDTGDRIFVRALEGENLNADGNNVDRFFGANGGEFLLFEDGTLQFDPRNDFEDLRPGQSRTTTARYTIADGRGGTDTATISIRVQGSGQSSNALHFLSPVNPPSGQITNIAEASGTTVITNYSVESQGSSALGNVNLSTLSDGTLALAVADINVVATSNPDTELISTSSQAFAQNGIYNALANSRGTVVGSFAVDAQETFSFDFTSFLDVEATTSNPNSEFAQALGESTFVLLNANTENIVDFFTVSGGVVTTENNDFFLLNHTDNVTLNTNVSDFDFGSNSEFISGLYRGSYEYTPNSQTDLVLVELNTSFVNLSGDFLINNLGNGVIYGNLNDNTINGTTSNDTIYASLGDDFVRGNDGNDTIEGGYGNDILRGNRGNDRLGGALGDDELYGGTNDDLLLGGYGNDLLEGSWGDDTLNGEEGNDIVNGGEGNDILYGDGDILLNTNTEFAGDSVNVGQGEDPIDRQISGDILIGGGADTFVFDYDANYGGDYDVIKDFQAGVDTVHFEDASNIDNQVWYNQGISSGNISNTQNGVLVRFTNNNRFLLEDVSLNELSSSDFTFS